MPNLRVKTIYNGETLIKGSALDQLRSSLRGSLILPDNDFYEQSRKLWNGMIDKKPGLIAKCRGTADVITCVKFAREHAILIAVRGGGHNVAGNALCDGGMVVDMSEMSSVRVDLKKNEVHIEGGALLGNVDHETFVHGLATPMGVVSATGYAGLTLHGGMGWQLRKHGLSADNLVEAEIIRVCPLTFNLLILQKISIVVQQNQQGGIDEASERTVAYA
jgi:FAD/FMN-containing dehydrogenase